MKRMSLQKSLLIVRLCIIAAILVLLSLFLVSFKTAESRVGDLWKQLGLTQQEGTEKIKNSFLNNYLDHWGARNARNIATGNRAAVAQDLLAYTKTFINGPAFKAAYAKERANSKPQPRNTVLITKEAMIKERTDELKKAIKETEEFIKKYPAGEKDARKSIADMEKTIKDYQTPGNQLMELLYTSTLEEQKFAKQDYENQLKEWEENYPEDHRKRISKCLQEYLDIARTVDFDAATTEKSGKKVFVKREYEQKSGDWKMIYRAGKEVYNVAKPFTEQWLKEIQ